MSIEEIKDINKLRQMLKSEMQENKYLKECCKDAGLELQKHSFAWDGKEKNLVIQATELNEIFEAKEQECEELKIYIESNEQQVKEVETLVMDNDRLINELDQLKAENEELKNFHINLVGVKECEIKELVKYKQALTEIKDIAEKAAEESGVFKEYFKRNNYSWKQHQLRALTCKYNIILQKCEVLDE